MEYANPGASCIIGRTLSQRSAGAPDSYLPPRPEMRNGHAFVSELNTSNHISWKFLSLQEGSIGECCQPYADIIWFSESTVWEWLTVHSYNRSSKAVATFIRYSGCRSCWKILGPYIGNSKNYYIGKLFISYVAPHESRMWCRYTHSSPLRSWTVSTLYSMSTQTTCACIHRAEQLPRRAHSHWRRISTQQAINGNSAESELLLTPIYE